MRKRLLLLVATGIAAVSVLAGCSTKAEAKQTTGTSQSVQAADGTESETETEGKTLVVYYSATGSTERVANVIAGATGADLLKLEPAEPYTDADLNWRDDGSRVSREHDNPNQRKAELLSTTVEDWDSVSTVYIGYPIWWGIAAWPVDGFIGANDFAGKTVIPFCTSSSSGLGESGNLLAEMAGTGDWQEGMRFGSGFSEEDVRAWIDSM